MAGIGKVGFVAAVVALIAAVPAADAQFRLEFSYCDRLQSQYLGAVERSGGSYLSGRRMVQMDQISRQLSQAQVAARRYGCTGGFLFFGPRPGPQCPSIMATVNRLSQQLAQLRGDGFGYGGFFDNPEMEAARLRDMLNQNGCGVPVAGGYRTLCVRTCDGYYFPIESMADSGRFQTDAMVCQSMYASDGQAELFIQANADEVADATSLSGARYGDQPFAFAYRDSYAPACVTQLHEGIDALKQRYFSRLPLKKRGPAVAAIKKQVIPLPEARPPLTEDPETISNLAGSFMPQPVAPAVAMSEAPGKSVRMVGPAYYADLFNLSEAPQPASAPGFNLVGPAAAEEAPAAPGPEP